MSRVCAARCLVERSVRVAVPFPFHRLCDRDAFPVLLGCASLAAHLRQAGLSNLLSSCDCHPAYWSSHEYTTCIMFQRPSIVHHQYTCGRSTGQAQQPLFSICMAGCIQSLNSSQ